jgi:cysteine desulfurase family protein (TIGR01976 family)
MTKEVTSVDAGSRPRLDWPEVRGMFPALRRQIRGQPVVFADAPGGTQVPESVITAIAGYLRDRNANTGGAFATSIETDQLIADARMAAADLLGSDPGEVVFGPNMTTLTFALSRAVAREIGPDDELVVTVLDHDANVAPWLAIAEERGAVVRWVDVAEGDGTLDLDSLDAALSERTRVVAFTLASNALGTVPPVADVVRRVRAQAPRALIVADAVHFAQHRLLDVREVGVDVLFCSAYKFFGPHLGLMWGRPDLLDRLRPYKVRPAPDAAPDRWETGTLNHEGLAGLVAAVDYLAGLARRFGTGRPSTRRAAIIDAFEVIAEHESELSRRFLERASDVPGLRLFGIIDPDRISERTPTFALRSGDAPPREVAAALGDQGIFVWDGNYFAQAVMERLGLEETGGAVRAGFCHYHTLEEVDRVAAALPADQAPTS